MPQPTVAIIGASNDRRKFGNRAVRAYAACGYRVFPIHPREKIIEGERAFASIADIPVEELDRASLYVAPDTGITLLPQLASKTIHELWLNPGSDSPELIAHARAIGLNVILGCSILDIGVDPHTLEKLALPNS